MKATHVFTRDFRVADSRSERIYRAGMQVTITTADWFRYGVEQGAIVPISDAAPAAEPEGQGAESGTLPRRRDGESDLQFAERLSAHMRQKIGTPSGDLGDQVVALLRQRPAGA